MAAALTRARIVVALLTCLLAGPSLIGQAPPLDPWREFPSYDMLIASRLRRGAQVKDAARQLVLAPASLQTFKLLVDVDRWEDALAVLRRGLESADVSQTIDALGALSGRMTFSAAFSQGDQTRGYSETIRQLVAPVRARIASLPREDAARLAWAMVGIDQRLDGRGSQGWSQRLTQFVRDYDGTEAALLAQVDLLGSNYGQLLKAIADLDQFAKDRPGTVAAAKALYQEGSQLSGNVAITGVEPRGSDPTDRLLRVSAIVSDLESGRYPPNQWVEQAPSLLIGFFVSPNPAPAYSPANLDRAIETYTTFIRSHLQMPGALDSLGNSIGYVLVGRLGDLFQLKGDRVGGIERTLTDLERTAANPGAVQLFRGMYYASQSTGGPQADRAMMAEKARTALAALAAADQGAVSRQAASRQALATEAALDYYVRDYARALPEYQQYVARYPTSSWAWVAALRIGDCYERAGDWTKAAGAYSRAATSYQTEPVAQVLGGAFAARALEAQDHFDEALAEATRALNAWDPDFGPEYSLTSSQAPLAAPATGPQIDRWLVKRDELAARVSTLERDLRQADGRLLARGRWQVGQQQFTKAIDTITTFLRTQPGSPAAADARALLHRAQLEVALDLAAVEGPHYDKAKALAALSTVATEPFDSATATAALAKAAVLVTDGAIGDAEALMAATLDSWVATQRSQITTPPVPGLDADIAEIRQVVFRPLGDLPVYNGMRINAFGFPAALPRFIIVRPDLQVKTADGQVHRRTVYQTFPDFGHVLFLTTDELALVGRLVPTIGGTRRRATTQVMETPNQPAGASVDILTFWNRFFPARPGHWAGWELETYPSITQIEFLNAECTKANAAVTIGYSGATVVLEKVDGKWRAVRLINQWIT
jgi:tetratricopeptide (TPR) repeat protein